MTHQRRRSTVLLAGLLLAVAGCTAYVEPTLPKDQLAVLEADGKWPAYVLFIVTIDDQDPGLLTKKVNLAPGTRIVRVRYEEFGGLKGNPITLTLEAKAGRAYRVEGRCVATDRWSAWIVDTATNEVVAGRRP
jgi:hypothetical protein